MTAVSAVETGKQALRKKFTGLRNSLAPEVRRQYDADIRRNLGALRCFREAECVAAFIRHGAEVDLSPLFKGKRLFLPRFNGRSGAYEMVAVEDLELDLLPGRYGIPEPSPSLPAADPDFVTSRVLFLVPAVACDRQGHRLGRGGCYYDRLLAGVKIPPVAVIYSCQLSDGALPGTARDIPMGIVVTEREVIEVNREIGVRK